MPRTLDEADAELTECRTLITELQTEQADLKAQLQEAQNRPAGDPAGRASLAADLVSVRAELVAATERLNQLERAPAPVPPTQPANPDPPHSTPPPAQKPADPPQNPSPPTRTSRHSWL